MVENNRKDTNQPLVCFASDVGISALRPLIKEWAGKCPIILNHFDKGVSILCLASSKIGDGTPSYKG